MDKQGDELGTVDFEHGSIKCLQRNVPFLLVKICTELSYVSLLNFPFRLRGLLIISFVSQYLLAEALWSLISTRDLFVRAHLIPPLNLTFSS